MLRAGAFGFRAGDVVLDVAEPDRRLRVFEEDAHLVVVLVAGEPGAVQRRADFAAQDLETEFMRQLKLVACCRHANGPSPSAT